MPASFMTLHKVEKKIIKALEGLTEQERQSVIDAALAILRKEGD